MVEEILQNGWLIGTGIATVTPFVRQILTGVIQEIANDVGTTYFGKLIERSVEVPYSDALIDALGDALKELLSLIESELLDAELSEAEVDALTPAVERFVYDDAVQDAIGNLLIEPAFVLDVGLFAHVWQSLAQNEEDETPKLPDDFSWQRVAKRFARAAKNIRELSPDLAQFFRNLAAEEDTKTLREMQGPTTRFDLDAYREALRERYANLSLDRVDLDGSSYNRVRLWQVFVPQTVRESHNFVPQSLLDIPKEYWRHLHDKGEVDATMLAEMEEMISERGKAESRRAYAAQSPRLVMDVCADKTLKRIVILGDPGAGKSSLLHALAVQWADIPNATERETTLLPLLIELREYNQWPRPNGKSFVSYLHDAPVWHRLNQLTLDHVLRQPERAILLLDGLDEVFDPGEREQVINDIHRFSNDYPQTRVIVTSRVIGYKPKRLRDADFRDFMLQDFDQAQIEDFLVGWHKHLFDDKAEGARKRQRLHKAIQDSRPIAMLAGNPLLLTMMAIINRHQELPRHRASLYDKATELLLYQWDTERALQSFSEYSDGIDIDAKRAILQRVAHTMQGSETGLRGNIIHRAELLTLVQCYLDDELNWPRARAAAKAIIDQLHERNFILSFLGGDHYAFVHRTFLEYFCALDIVARFEKERTMTEAELIALFETHCGDDDWREVLRLICGMIHPRFVGQIVERLAMHTDLDQWNGKTPLPEFPLAIWALSEARNVSQLEEAGRLLMRQTIAMVSKTSFDDALNKFMMEDMTNACRDLGTLWPGQDELRRVALSQIDRIMLGYGTILWPRLVAYATGDCELMTTLALATQDEYTPNYRAAALLLLAEKWPDDTTRAFLAQRAVEDKNFTPRQAALLSLVEKWPDERTRALLAQRAVEDDNEYPRSSALSSLAEKWPDERTRALLAQRAVEDDNYDPRRTALSSLAEKWPDETTRALIQQQSRVDGFPASYVAKEHSRFGEILFTRDLDGLAPYLDPREGVAQDHIEGAAQRSGVKPAQIEEMVRSLSAHMGWDIRQGSGVGVDTTTD
ncbi:MAG: NACHT domain-containing protein [Chloroflexota bacterium]